MGTVSANTYLMPYLFAMDIILIHPGRNFLPSITAMLYIVMIIEYLNHFLVKQLLLLEQGHPELIYADKLLMLRKRYRLFSGKCQKMVLCSQVVLAKIGGNS